MDIIWQLVQLIGPAVVAWLTVPLLGQLKKAVVAIDKLPSVAQQLIAILMAYGLTLLGGFLSVALPTELALFGEADVSALLSAAMAFAIHAGKKAKEAA